MSDTTLKTLEERIRAAAVQNLAQRINSALRPIRDEIANAQRQIEFSVPLGDKGSFLVVNANTALALIEAALTEVLSNGEADKLVAKLAKKIASLPDLDITLEAGITK